MKTNLDVRILSLGKKVSRNEGNESQKNHTKERYVSAHYFDCFEITKVDINEKQNSFIEESYKTIKQLRSTSDGTNLRIKQNIIIFKFFEDNGDNIERFWDKESEHVFITMLKIASDLNSHYSLAEVERSVRDIIMNHFKKSKIDVNSAIIYYTYDFSDLIIISKDVSVKKMQEILWEINFRIKNDDNKKLIMDTITLYGINEKIFYSIAPNRQDEQEKIGINREKLPVLNTNTIDATITFGIKSPDGLSAAYKYLEESNCKNNYNISQQFGRRDVLLQLWNVTVLELVKLYGELKDIEDLNSIKIISSFNIDDSTKQALLHKVNLNKSENENEVLKSLKDAIFKSVEDYTVIAEENGYLDATEIYRSLCELLDSGFSEEFVVSIYYAFYIFLKICIEKGKDHSEEIIDFQKEFFSYINTLSHCTMHGEKCFVQSAPFNSILIDIPPKILAYYTALANKIVNVLRAENNKQLFSFIFVPNFNKHINVRSISPGSDTDNRLLAVYINEEMLHNPYRVACVMFHEIAHFVGDETRCRKERLQCIIKTLIDAYMTGLGVSPAAIKSLNLYDSIEKDIDQRIKEENNENNSNDYTPYLSKIEKYIDDTQGLISIFLNPDKKNYFDNYDNDKKVSDYIDENDPLFFYINSCISTNEETKEYGQKLLFSIITDKIKSVNTDEYDKNHIAQFPPIINAYSEAYSDLILCIFTSINLEQYLYLIKAERGVAYKKDDLKVNKLIKKDDLNNTKLALILRMMAIVNVHFRINIEFPLDADREIARIKVMYDYLVEYLIKCKSMIDKMPKEKFPNIISQLGELSNKATFYSMYDEILNYKKTILKDIQKIESQ